MCLQIIYIWYVCKQELALNNLQWLIYYKTKPTFSSSCEQKTRNFFCEILSAFKTYIEHLKSVFLLCFFIDIYICLFKDNVNFSQKK